MGKMMKSFRDFKSDITRQIMTHSHRDRFSLSTLMRYTKKNWTLRETTDSIIGRSKEEANGEVRWSKLPKPEANQ